MSGRAPRRELQAVLLGLASALFFTSTYVLNRAMASAGGHWAWSAALRYLFTLPLLIFAALLCAGTDLIAEGIVRRVNRACS